jgi:hypothetical protein
MGVIHPDASPPQPLSDVRGADARSAQIGGPDSIAQGFQVSAYSGEPRPASAACNLLSKDAWRAALSDEAAELGPEVAGVGGSGSLPCDAEGLAGARPGPDGFIVRYAGETQGERPSPDPGEEVALPVPHKVIWRDIGDAPFVDVARRDVAGGDEGPQPRGGEGVDLVVVGGGHAAPIKARASSTPTTRGRPSARTWRDLTKTGRWPMVLGVACRAM